MDPTPPFRAEAANLAAAARHASTHLAVMNGGARSAVLVRTAALLREGESNILEANARDFAAASDLAPAMLERLRLTPERVEKMASAVEQIARQDDPVGRTTESTVRPTGLRVEKRRVPIGVLLFLYESRPNVTADAAALCLRSANAVILRGGKEAFHSNRAIHGAFAQSLGEAGVPPAAVTFVETTDRTMLTALLKQQRDVDLVIPRGGEGLIRAVVAEAAMPVLKHFTGNCHIYVDQHLGGLETMVREVCVNAKTSYPGGGVCNAVEHLLFHRDAAARVLPDVCRALADAGVEVRGDGRTRELYPAAKPATEADWDEEYLSFTISAAVVDDLDAAVSHINRHGSRHTDAILSADARSIERFTAGVDTASVVVNASTRLADGGEYGLGAEIGISTDKLHARGPMGAADLTTYKWVVTGDGQLRV